MLVFVIAVVGALGYVLANPRAEDRFTEFYILGPEGKARDYPNKLVVGQRATVVAGIVNREGEKSVYILKVTSAGEELGKIGPISLARSDKWEGKVGFAPVRAGADQKVEFVLYKGQDSQPYDSLHIFVDVAAR
ncbi:MAG: DUF1616 domain-containing protein [Chloroflexi bacterium]|nr:DUF1616 domain-containing protein [Chloroflexota bacterium]